MYIVALFLNDSPSLPPPLPPRRQADVRIAMGV